MANNVTVRNDSPSLQSFFPFGGRLAIGGSITVDTDTNNPLFTKMLKVTSGLTVTAGTFPTDDQIDAAISSFVMNQQWPPAGIQMTDEFAGTSSHQTIAADLTLAAAAGTSTTGQSKFLAAMMGNLFGTSLTKTKNYLAGLIGHYSVTGTRATTYPAGAVLAGIGDGSTLADGAVVAYVDGDSALTTANAAFKAMSNNSTAGSGFNYGLDLTSAGHDGYNALAILKADVRGTNDVCILNGDGVPVDGVSGTGAGFAGPGSIYVRTATGKLYLNGNTKASPTWKIVTSA